MYLQVRNILALTADYDPTDKETQHFYQIVSEQIAFCRHREDHDAGTHLFPPPQFTSILPSNGLPMLFDPVGQFCGSGWGGIGVE